MVILSLAYGHAREVGIFIWIDLKAHSSNNKSSDCDLTRSDRSYIWMTLDFAFVSIVI